MNDVWDPLVGSFYSARQVLRDSSHDKLFICEGPGISPIEANKNVVDMAGIKREYKKYEQVANIHKDYKKYSCGYQTVL